MKLNNGNIPQIVHCKDCEMFARFRVDYKHNLNFNADGTCIRSYHHSIHNWNEPENCVCFDDYCSKGVRKE